MISVCNHPGLYFINVLPTAFTPVDPKSVKDTDNLTVFFTLLGSTSIKAVRRMLVKLTPDEEHYSTWQSRNVHNFVIKSGHCAHLWLAIVFTIQYVLSCVSDNIIFTSYLFPSLQMWLKDLIMRQKGKVVMLFNCIHSEKIPLGFFFNSQKLVG